MCTIYDQQPTELPVPTFHRKKYRKNLECDFAAPPLGCKDTDIYLYQPRSQQFATSVLQYAEDLYQEPDDMCIDRDAEMVFQDKSMATVPVLTLTHDGVPYPNIFQEAQLESYPSICNNVGFPESVSFLRTPETALQESWISDDSSMTHCEPMVLSSIASEIECAVTYPIRPKLPNSQVSEILGRGLDKLLPMENITMLVTHKNYKIYRYWTLEDTIFGYSPDLLQAKSVECILNSNWFGYVCNQERTQSYDECILVCGDRIKVVAKSGEERWMSLWLKESKIACEDFYVFIFVDNCVPIARIPIDETGHITEKPTVFEGCDITDYPIDGEQLQGFHYKDAVQEVDQWHISAHGVHYFIVKERFSVDIIAVPLITGMVSVKYDKTIAWSSETLSRCLFNQTPQEAEHCKIDDRLPEYPLMIDDWLAQTNALPRDDDSFTSDSSFNFNDQLHGLTLMCEWWRNKFGKRPRNDDEKSRNDDGKPILLARSKTGLETQVELYIKFSSRQDVPHWVFVKNVPDWGKSITNYKVLENLGQGSYGSVYAAYDKKSLRKVTIKYVDKSRVVREGNRRKTALPIEIEVLRALQQNPHENCCEMYAYFSDPTYHYIVMGNYGKTLFRFIEENRELSEYDSQQIFLQIAKAVNHLHEVLNIVHRDIKDENVMIDDQLRVRLIDFGSAATVKTRKRKFNTFVGTPNYASPEVLSGQTYTGKPQDIWALGVLLYTIIHLSNPFDTPADIINRNLVFPIRLDNDLRDLIVGMFNGVRTRLTIKDVVGHRWVTKAIP
ncbi:kinase-like domain-containing protein [Fennellomyces sp. T-0311]|nr:kinase-like domain-containing protein [Fennellomyces sp. T-0311]